tara:strand:+ start:5528 stop:5941 length:414 start_codon:yes stop_codon:yes gene_type:complete
MVSRKIIIIGVGLAMAVGVSKALIDHGYDTAVAEFKSEQNEALMALQEQQTASVKKFVEDKREATRLLEDYYKEKYESDVASLNEKQLIQEQAEVLNEIVTPEINVLQATCDTGALDTLNRVFESSRDITRPTDYIY